MHVLSPQKTHYLWDNSLSTGGPIKKDRLWFFYRPQTPASGTDAPGMYYNKNAGDLTKWLYEPDFNRPAQQRQCSGHAQPDAAPDGAGHARATS